MAVPDSVRPNRGLVFPFLVVFFPMIWFVYREIPVRIVDGQQVVTPLSRTLALAIGAAVASYSVAVIVVSAIRPREGFLTPWRRALFRPTNGTLLTLVALCSVFVVYVALNAATNLPYWFELLVGISLLWPLLVAMLVSFAAGNAVPALQAFGLQAGLVMVGLGLSAVWIFVLSSGIARVLFPIE
jgi:uncharacterized membrane protein YhdT